jgi:hypothetical protein
MQGSGGIGTAFLISALDEVNYQLHVSTSSSLGK